MVQQMFADFFLFKLAQSIGSGAKGAGRTLQWTPALLTPHDVFMCLGFDCMNYHKYKIQRACLFVFVHVAQESMKIENRKI